MMQAKYFDGINAAPLLVDASLKSGDLVIYDSSGAEIARWALAQLNRSLGQIVPDRLTLVPVDTPDARIVVETIGLEPIYAERFARLARGPETRSLGSRFGIVVAFLTFVGFFISYGVPNLASLAVHLIPKSLEKTIGDEAVSYAMTEHERCSTSDARVALERLFARLKEGRPSDYDFNIQIFNDPTNNAFAFPGGHIVTFRGFLEHAGSPDALAGVLAHEMGHVIEQHSMRRWLRERGLTGILDIVIGGVPGSSVLNGVVEIAVSSSYSRADESAADEIAFEILTRSHIATTGMANFFATLTTEEAGKGGALWLSSHPATDERESRARSIQVPNATPALTEQEWRAVKTMCGHGTVPRPGGAP